MAALGIRIGWRRLFQQPAGPRRAVLLPLLILGLAVFVTLLWVLKLLVGRQPLREGMVASTASLGLTTIRRSLEDELSAVRGERFFEEHERLKLYLMLGDPKRLDVSWATGQLANGSPLALQRWLGALKSAEVAALELDGELIERVRAALQRVSFEVRLEALIIRQIDAERVGPAAEPTAENLAFPPMSLLVLLRSHPDAARHLRSRRHAHGGEPVTVRGAFTFAGLGAWVRALNDPEELLEAQAWVGAFSPDERDPRALAAAVTRLATARYGPEYATSWDAFLADLYVEPPKTADAALELYGLLSAADGLPPSLISILERDTLWVSPSSERPAKSWFPSPGVYHPPPMLLDTRGIKRVLDAAVRDHFQPVVDCVRSAYSTPQNEARIVSYTKIVRQLHDELAMAKQADPHVDLRGFRAPIAAAHAQVELLFSGCGEHARAVWAPLLVDPLRLSDERDERKLP